MPRLAAFLRAINVGGRRVKNDELVHVASNAGFTGVQTFLASGNLVLDAGDRTPEEAGAALEQALEAGLGFATEVFVRTTEQMMSIITAEVFDPSQVAQAKADPQIILLRDRLEEPTTSAVLALSTEVDRLAVRGREVHWLPGEGVGRAALDWNALTPLLGTNTVRTRNTLVRIHDRFLTA